MENIENLRIKLYWPKSKETILTETLGQLEKYDGRQKRMRYIRTWSCAAAILILVALVCNFYTVTQLAPRSEHAVVYLPCNSKATLNADSKISYKPLMWLISRRVELKGEGCFEVKPGKSFKVQSGSNSVTVLGTVFNVYARQSRYSVTCVSGTIEVRSLRESVILGADMQVSVHENQIIINRNIESSIVTGWVQGKFVFDKTPLNEVIAEVERQYDIHITPTPNVNHLYSGNFSKTDKPDELLEVIGKPFGIQFSVE